MNRDTWAQLGQFEKLAMYEHDKWSLTEQQLQDCEDLIATANRGTAEVIAKFNNKHPKWLGWLLDFKGL